MWRCRMMIGSSSKGIAGIVLSAIVRTRAEDAIRHQATHDPLTGLPNRTLFNDRLEHALTRRARVGGYVAVMVVDLDGFKNVNDSLGHLTGDALLIAVADRFDAHLRDFDTIARLGGDEFAILVDDLDAPDQAGRVAQRVLDALFAPLGLRDRTVAIGASIGIALADRPDIKADRLLSHADAAMYRAKREGKGCYRVFEAAMHTAAVERMTLEQALRARAHRTGPHRPLPARHRHPHRRRHHVRSARPLAPSPKGPTSRPTRSSRSPKTPASSSISAAASSSKRATRPPNGTPDPATQHLGQRVTPATRPPQLRRTRRRRAHPRRPRPPPPHPRSHRIRPRR